MKDKIVKSKMSKDLISVRWDAEMQEAADLMEEQRIRHLAVTDELGAVVGILSNRDVNRAMSPKRIGFAPDSKISEYMNWPVITIDQNLSIRDAAQGMIDEKISAFLVTDAAKMIVGIITSEDLLKALSSLLSTPNIASRITYSPVVGELLREAQSSGL